MKKTTKILASVLTVALSLSAVVMPITVEAAGYGAKYIWKTLTEASDITDMVGRASKNSIVDGRARKPASDNVAKIAEQTGRRGGK